MKNLITLEHNVLNINPQALMVSEFKKIWDRDRSTRKNRALKELAFVYHTTDYQSVYRNYHPNTRESKIKLDIFEDREWKQDRLITEAQEKYKELQTTISMELLKDIELGVDKLRNYFRDAEFDDDDDGKAAKNFIANIKSMGDLVKGIKSLREEVEKELTDKMQLRGGSSIGHREMPPDKRG